HYVFVLLSSAAPTPAAPSFPTRRSSDLRPGSAARRRRPARERRWPGQRGRGPSASGGTRGRARRGRGAGAPPEPACRPTRCRSRSEEHTSELQSRENLVCRLLLEKKKRK